MCTIFISLLLASSQIVISQGSLLNVAAQKNGATCTASSEYDQRFLCKYAIDSNPAPGYNSEWAGNREKVGLWLNVTFSKTYLVLGIRYLQRCWVRDQTKDVKFTFDNGFSIQKTIPFHNGGGGWSCTGIEWQYYSVSPILASSLKYEVLSVYPQTTNTPGIRELEVWAEPLLNVAATANGATCTASSELDQRFLCKYAIDNNPAPGFYSEWAGNREKVALWFNVVFSKPYLVYAVKYLQRCWVRDQTKDVNFTFDNGQSFQKTIPFHNGAGGWSCTGIEWQTYSVGPFVASSLKYEVLSVYPGTTNTPGIRELQVLAMP